MIITGSTRIAIQCTEALTDGAETGSSNLQESLVYTFANGTTAGKCDRKYTAALAIAASGSLNLVLSALTDDLGRSVAFARVRTLVISNSNTVDGDDLVVGNAGTHPWAGLTGSGTATFTVKSMGCEVKVAMNTTGFVVTSGSSDQLLISNPTAHTITGFLVLEGASV